MTRPWRFSIAGLLLVTTAIGVAIAGWAKAVRLQGENERLNALVGRRPPSVNGAYIRSEPLLVTLSNRYDAGWAIDRWHASVDVTGGGRLSNDDNAPSIEYAPFTVSKTLLARFREALIAEKFFDLPEEIGDDVPDGGAESLTVVLGDRAKTLRIQYLGNMVKSPARYSAEERKQAARALRIWIAARSWIDLPGGSDDLNYARTIVPRLDPPSQSSKP